jgi:hypothetical protein
MSYRAKVVKIMIASPSDVAGERQTIRNVIQEWNNTHSEDKNIVLMPVGWESHSAPALGGRPQELINKQVLEGCDLLIAVFWTKIGTPTGKSVSGTVEEIEKHVKAKKPAMIYFSLAPFPLDLVDLDQYKALQEFKAELRERGLYAEYTTPDDFREKLSRQLAQTVNRHFVSKKNGDDDADSLIARPKVPSLSEPAKIILIEASQDDRGTIWKPRSRKGLVIQTAGKDLVENQDPRTNARWEAALRELQDNGLIQDRGGRGEVFAVTDEGYRVADLLKERQLVPQ